MRNSCALPPIDFIQNYFTLRLPMLFFEILHHPLNKVIFEHSLDNLVKEVRGDEFIDVCMRKVLSEWLEGW